MKEELTGKIPPDTTNAHCVLGPDGNYPRSERTLGFNVNESGNERHDRLVRAGVIKEDYKGEAQFLDKLARESEQKWQEGLRKARERER